MALTTTIGGASSDSFITLAAWETYATAQGWTTAGTDAVKETYLRRAALWLDQKTWVGTLQYETQSLSWPRVTSVLVDGWTIDIDTIPQAIQDAQAELAWLIHEGANPFATVTNGAVKSTEAKAGPVATKTEYANFRETPLYLGVAAMIAPYLKAGAGQVRLGRG